MLNYARAAARRVPLVGLRRVQRYSVARRIELFEQFKAQTPTASAASSAGGEEATVVFEDVAIAGDAPVTVTKSLGWRPVEFLKGSKAPPANPVVAALVDGQVRDLSEPIYSRSTKLKLLRFQDDLGQQVYWHSAAHILGASLEAVLGPRLRLTDGPPLDAAEGGFFYEFEMPQAAPPADPASAAAASASGATASGGAATASSKSLEDVIAKARATLAEGGTKASADIFPMVETLAQSLMKAKAPFERIVVTREQAAELFAENAHKLAVLRKLPASEPISVYRCGPFVDMCRGPHVPHTGVFKAWHLYRYGASTAAAPPPLPGAVPAASSDGSVLLQRLYGIAFPTNDQLQAWKDRLEQAKLRDHRAIGKAQSLFFFHEMSPGSAFMLPHGTRIYNKLVSFLRAQYASRGYEEVMSPLIYKKGLWATSGHLQNYAENMFTVVPGMSPLLTTPAAAAGAADGTAPAVGAAAAAAASHADHHASCCGGHHDHEEAPEDVLGLKPMNCPGHCLIFAQRAVSYRELPMRLADFSSLHRNEATGALGGMTRLRRFQQDDAHIFCAPEHIEKEVHDCLDFVQYVYGLFNFSFRVKLSTRPEKYVGEIATWNSAEDALQRALASFMGSGAKITVDEGGGAFYGPKLDVFVKDAIGREHQCATIQLDFQLPGRFGLEYRDASGSLSQPVIIHRAILGSIERFLGVLIEHTAGKWPFWLSPRQIAICTVADRHEAFAQAAAQALSATPRSSDASTGAPAGVDHVLHVDVHADNKTIAKKVRDAQVAQYNLIAVAGDAEMGADTLAVRSRDRATYEAFCGHVRAAAAAAGVDCPVLPDVPAASGGAASSVATASATPWNSPLVTLPIPLLRRVCEEWSKPRASA